MKAVQCPVCNGTGLKAVIPVMEKCETVPCHGCNGKGWVEVGGEITPQPFNPFWPWSPQVPSSPPTWTWTEYYPPPNPMATAGTACGQCGKPF